MGIINRFMEWISNMKVRKQLLGIYIIAILVPILIIGVYLTNMLCAMVVDKSIDEASVNIERIRERLDEKIKIANAVAEALYIDEKLKNILSTHYNHAIDVINDYNKATEMSTYLIHYKELSSIRVYTTNTSLLNNSHFIQITPEIQQEFWYREAIERGSRMEWVYKYDEYKNQYNMALIRSLRDRKGGLLGVLVINLEPSAIQEIIKDEPYDTAIILNGNMAINVTNQKIFEDELDKMRSLKMQEEKSTRLKVQTAEGVGYIIFTQYTPSKTIVTDIEICMYMSIGAITQETRQIIAKSLGIILMSACIATLLIWAFTKRFSERIILVRKEMAKVVSGDFNIRKSISGNDEIGELYGDIYWTVQSVQALVKEIYEAKVQKEELKRRQKEMQFEMLASQINPHFLYNTLETIRMKALCSGEVELARIVKMLSKLLRRNLEVSEKLVTIDSELEMMKAYLEIQKFRFGERITYEIQCEVEAKEYVILPLLLQPIIENAFIHGLERKLGAGTIKCHLSKVEDNLQIVIEDDGLGMEEEKLEKLMMSLEKGSEKVGRVGLKNIYERIELYYDHTGNKEYGMTIESKPNKGTKVIMILPLIRGEEV